MKSLKSLLSVFIIAMLAGCSQTAVEADYAIVPMPQEVAQISGEQFRLDNSTKILYPKGNEAQKRIAGFLAGYIKQTTGLDLNVAEGETTDNAIILQADLKSDKKEAYSISIDKSRILINGSDDAGTFYGVQTIRKSIPANATGSDVLFPAVNINDYPRFGYRGMHLDVARHFFSVDEVKTYIDILALHNINRFHWHLTDDQGWRIEIKKYPELTTIGSKRAETVIGRNSGKFDGKPYGPFFFTQDEVKDIVAYASDRFITIIPEIDLPGHMLAALAAYPELGCTGGPYKVSEEWGIFEDVLCAGNEDIYPFLENIFTEVIELFPGEYIHIGGDECPKTRWEACPKCQAKIKVEGIKGDSKHTKEEKLQSYVMHRVENFLNEKGRKIIGWDEILEGGASPTATIMSWRGIEGGIVAAKTHRNVIMVPTDYFYFDYYQSSDIKNEPFSIGGYVPVEKVYSFNPMPEELTKDEQQYIIGVQANLWSEYVSDFKHAEYMVLPRMGALAEVQWTMPEKKDYKQFLIRLDKMTKIYAMNGYDFATHIYDIDVDIAPDMDKKSIKVSMSTFDDAPIYYTVDGTEPTEKSQKYESPLEIKTTAVLKAAAFRDGKPSPIYEKSFNMNKATFKKVTLLEPSVPKFTYGGSQVLVDGMNGGETFASGEWIGFQNNDFIAVVDLGEETDVSKVTIGDYIDVNDWIFGAREYTISLSSDNKNFKQAYNEKLQDIKSDQPKEIRYLTAKFDTQKARYVKIHTKTIKSLPDWSQGKGNPGFVFIDEIQID